MMSRAAATIALILVCVAPRVALAQAHAPAQPGEPAPPAADERAVAERLAREAKAAFDEGRYAEAVDRLQTVYRLVPSPVVKYNLGRACRELARQTQRVEDLVCARDAYVAYLKERPDAEDHAVIEQLLGELAAAIESRSAPEPAPPPAPSGAPSAPARRDAAATPEPPTGEHEPSVAPWIVAGIGVVGLAVGIGLGVTAKARESDARDEPVQIDAENGAASARGFATAANVTFGIAGAVSVAGVVWGIVDVLAASRASSTAVQATPSGIAMRF